MYKDFTEYCEQRKEVLEKLGVTKDVDKMIWDNAVDSLAWNYTQFFLSAK